MKDPVDELMLEFEKFKGQTLEDLRKQAISEETGIRFSAVRAEDGPRYLVVLCVTKRDDIHRLMVGLRLDRFPPIRQDWSSMVLYDLVVMTMQGMHSGKSSGLLAVPRFSTGSTPDAVALICVGLDSVTKLESLFEMPN